MKKQYRRIGLLLVVAFMPAKQVHLQSARLAHVLAVHPLSVRRQQPARRAIAFLIT